MKETNTLNSRRWINHCDWHPGVKSFIQNNYKKKRVVLKGSYVNEIVFYTTLLDYFVMFK